MLGCRPCLERPAAGEREREEERQLARDSQDQLTGRADTSLGSCGRLGSLQAAGISANRWAGTSSLSLAFLAKVIHWPLTQDPGTHTSDTWEGWLGEPCMALLLLALAPPPGRIYSLDPRPGEGLTKLFSSCVLVVT